MRLEVFYSVTSIARIIAVLVVLALPRAADDPSLGNDIVYGYWILNKQYPVDKEQDKT